MRVSGQGIFNQVCQSHQVQPGLSPLTLGGVTSTDLEESNCEELEEQLKSAKLQTPPPGLHIFPDCVLRLRSFPECFQGI